MKSQSGNVRILRISTAAPENIRCASIGRRFAGFPVRKSELSQSKPHLFFDDLREVSPPGWIFQSVPHRRGREKAAHFLQKIFAQLRFCFEGCGTALQQGYKLVLFPPMVPELYGDKRCGQRNTLLDQQTVDKEFIHLMRRR